MPPDEKDRPVSKIEQGNVRNDSVDGKGDLNKERLRKIERRIDESRQDKAKKDKKP
jgi:hypothetical protein